MPDFDVVILTESRYLNPKKVNDYIQNVLTEEQLLKEALESLNLAVARKDWADPDFDWSTTTCAIFRTTWDYFDKFDEFSAWLNEVEPLTNFINPISQVKWNMDKSYLKDLAAKGIRVIETLYILKGEKRTLSEILGASGWDDTILKPTVAATARHTYRINQHNVGAREEVFDLLIQNEDMMLQPFQHNILEKGEISFIMIGGTYTHSVLKKGKEGDFRVQDDFGGTLHEYVPTQKEIGFAEEVVRSCTPVPAYARVDLMWDNEGKLAVSEVELFEPELWFRRNKKAALLLAHEIKNRIHK